MAPQLVVIDHLGHVRVSQQPQPIRSALNGQGLTDIHERIHRCAEQSANPMGQSGPRGIPELG